MIDTELSPTIKEEDRLLRLLELEWERFSSSRIKYPDYWLAERGLGSSEEIRDAIGRTRKMCMNAGISVDDHFREIYIGNEERVFKSWMLSEFALKLTIIHIDSDSPLLARLQINMLR